MTESMAPAKVAPWQFDGYVRDEADGFATPEQIAVLEADPIAWRVSLQAAGRDAEDNLKSARALTGEEREQGVADLDYELRQLKAALARRMPQRAAEER